MIIINTVKIFKNLINQINPKYFALINKKNELFDNYEFHNNIYIKKEKSENNN